MTPESDSQMDRIAISIVCISFAVLMRTKNSKNSSSKNLLIIQYTKLLTSHAAFCWSDHYFVCQEYILTAFCCISQ